MGSATKFLSALSADNDTAPPTTTKGDLSGYSTTQARVPVGSNNQVLTADSTTSLGVAYKTPVTPPTTTKGDLSGYSTAQARIPIGSNDQVLTADSGQALGLKWATPSGGATVTTNEIHPTSDFSTTSSSFVDATDYDTTIADESGGGFIASGIVGWYNSNNGSDNSSYKLVHGTTSQGITQVNNNFPKQAGTPISLPIEYMGSTDGEDLKIQASTSNGTSTARGGGDFVHVSILEVA